MMTELYFAGGAHRRSLTILRSPRARQMRLVVDPRDGTVRLTLPRRAALGHGLTWAETKRGWIEAQLAQLPQADPIADGMLFCVGGDMLRLDWSPGYPRNPLRVGDALRIGGPRDGLALRLLRWLKREARRVFEAETHEYAAKAGVMVPGVGIGDPVSRWGSCAASGNIRYSWRLILAPRFVRRATIAHEVAHRVHMNHSREFHALVRALFGEDPAVARRWLKTNGPALHWFGRAS